ncbi:MAG: hypothetical protein V1766_15985 [Pseudomonadota bacterium]
MWFFSGTPLNHQEALALTGRLQERKLLDGFRGNRPVDRDETARMLVALGTIERPIPGVRKSTSTR